MAPSVRYASMEILRHIQPEDIEDVSERYVPLYSTERESDTVKRVNITRYISHKEDDKTLELPLFIVFIVEHKTKVEYNRRRLSSLRPKNCFAILVGIAED